MKNNQLALILVGGKGTRLWPISRENHPKQFIEFIEGLSLFQLTIRRNLKNFKAQEIYIISGEQYKFTIFNQIDAMKLPVTVKKILKNNYILEPCSKNTAPALMLGLKFLITQNKCTPDTLIHVFPSDLIIESETDMSEYLETAALIASQDKMVVFGVKLNSPGKDYGYISLSTPFGKGFSVKEFVEKPSFSRAKNLITKGAFGNTGIFCFKHSVFIEELKLYDPDIAKFYDLSYEDLLNQFSQIKADSIDYAIMQKTRRAVVIKFDLRWSHLGNWDSFFDYHYDGKKCFSIGKSEFVESKRCFTFSKERLISLVGMEDVMVIDSADALLVVKKGFSEKVIDLTDTLGQKSDSLIKDSPTVFRPWGFYTILKESEGYKVKIIAVYPGKSLSLQKHKFRSEHWNVVEGLANITVGDKKSQLKRNQSAYISKGEKHKLQNPGKKILRIIEVQIGEYLGEDDIIRFDKY